MSIKATSVQAADGDDSVPSAVSAWPEFSPQSAFRTRKRLMGNPDQERITHKGTDYSNPYVRKPMAAKGGMDKDSKAIERPMTFSDPLSGFSSQEPALDAKRKRPRQLERPLATGRIRGSGLTAYRRSGK